MKNIHILPTDKPTTLFKDDFDNFIYSINIDQEQNHFEPQHIYITSDEEIKDNDWVYCPVLKKPVFICLDSILMFKNLGYDSNGNSKYKKEWLKKIILTTDSDLIKDGVQAIDDEFLEWFVKNSSCEWVEVNHFGMCCGNQLIAQCINCNQYNPVYKIIIPKEELEQETVGRQFHKTADMVISVVRNKETLEEAAKREYETRKFNSDFPFDPQSFKLGAEWMQERMYSEEEVLELILKSKIETSNLYYEDMKELFEQFKKK